MRILVPTLLLVPSLGLLAALPAQGGDRFFTVAATDADLRIVDPATAATLVTMPITISGGPLVQNAKGLAVHPATGELWAILFVSNQRQLAKINPNTAVATLIGSTGDNFASIAFDAGGTLYGVTGDGARVPETLYTLDQATGSPTFFMTLGNGDDGEAICHDPATNRLFHASGNNAVVLETIDLAARTVTNVPLSGATYFEAAAMTHWVGGNFLLADIGADLHVVSATGAVTFIGMMDHNPKGLAFLSTSNAAVFRPYGGGCAAQGGFIPVTSGSGTPAWGNAVTFRVLNAPGSAPAALAFGLGTGSAPISPTCAIQILPFAGIVVPIALGGTGAGQGTGSLPLTLPPNAGAADVYIQTAVIEATNIVLSNPLQVHVQ